MNQQDELLRLIRQIDETIDGLGEWHEATEWLEWVRKEVQRIMNASRPQVVESVDQLVALPVGSVVLTEQGGVYELAWREAWMETGDHNPHGHEDLSLPAAVLYTPQEAT